MFTTIQNFMPVFLTRVLSVATDWCLHATEHIRYFIGHALV